MSAGPLQILWVENGTDSSGWVSSAFSRQRIPLQIQKAGGLAEARQALALFLPDLIITDDVLPDGKGIELLSRDDHGDLRHPVIVMGRQANERIAVEVIKAGAMDFVFKTESAFAEMPHIVQRAMREWKLFLERRRDRESLRQSEERYRLLVENTLDGFFMAEVPSGIILFLNHRICELFGYTVEEGLEKTIWDVVAPGDHEKVRRGFQRAMKDGAMPMERQIYEVIRRDGGKFQAEISISIVTYQGKRVVQGILRDITEQNRLQQQLRHAQKMQAVGTLAGGIAHEFNNMMQAVSGYTELLLMNPDLDASSRLKLDKIRASTRRAAELTRQILIFGQRVENKFQTVDLNREAAHAGKLLKKTLPRMIDIQLDLGDDLQKISGDPAYLSQAIVNLGINARDAMPDGGQLTIQTRNVSLNEDYVRRYPGLEAGEYVMLTVSDTGHGMEKHLLEHIFEPFFTTRENLKHRGLGLSIVFGIIRDHKGYIIPYSEVGHGTTFKIYFPVVSPPKKSAPLAETKQGIPGGAETILVVDDETQIREFVVELLGDFGYTVQSAPDGETALEIFRRDHGIIDLVILDLIMPGIGGKKCLEELLRVDSSVSVIVSSGFPANGDIREMLEMGAKSYIGKPYNSMPLLKTIRQVLDQGPA